MKKALTVAAIPLLLVTYIFIPHEIKISALCSTEEASRKIEETSRKIGDAVEPLSREAEPLVRKVTPALDNLFNRIKRLAPILTLDPTNGEDKIIAMGASGDCNIARAKGSSSSTSTKQAPKLPSTKLPSSDDLPLGKTKDLLHHSIFDIEPKLRQELVDSGELVVRRKLQKDGNLNFWELHAFAYKQVKEDARRKGLSLTPAVLAAIATTAVSNVLSSEGSPPKVNSPEAKSFRSSTQN